MLIEFTVTRMDDRIVGVEVSPPHFDSIPPELPLVTRKHIKVSVYSQPQETAASFYHSLLRQMS
jgi:hypothetical protein